MTGLATRNNRTISRWYWRGRGKLVFLLGLVFRRRTRRRNLVAHSCVLRLNTSYIWTLNDRVPHADPSQQRHYRAMLSQIPPPLGVGMTNDRLCGSSQVVVARITAVNSPSKSNRV